MQADELVLVREKLSQRSHRTTVAEVLHDVRRASAYVRKLIRRRMVQDRFVEVGREIVLIEHRFFCRTVAYLSRTIDDKESKPVILVGQVRRVRRQVFNGEFDQRSL